MTPKAELEEIIKAVKPSVTVIGLGGAGSNIVTWIKEKGISGAKLVAANTDAAHLGISKADKLLLLGMKLCKGRGCGGYPEIGAEAAKESMDMIKGDLLDSDLVFIVAGLGGGTGTGTAPVIANLTRDAGILTVGCVTIPFSIEMARRDKAMEGIEKLREQCDTLVLIDNDRLRQAAGDLPLKPALGVANELVGSFVKNITESIAVPSLMNIDYADMRTITERGGISSIGIGEGEGEGEDRVSKAVSQALATPLLDITDISTSKGMLIHIAGGEDMTLEEVAKVGEMVAGKIPHTTNVAWGARIDESITGRVRVMAVLTGVESSFLGGKKFKPEKVEIAKAPETGIPKAEIEEEEELKFIVEPAKVEEKKKRTLPYNIIIGIGILILVLIYFVGKLLV
jgi:cell division protein FtsZ